MENTKMYSVYLEWVPDLNNAPPWRVHFGDDLEEAKKIARSYVWNENDYHVSLDRYENGCLVETIDFRK